MRIRHAALITVLALTMQLIWLPLGVRATTNEKGLALSPPRQFSEVAAGESTSGTVVVSNLTDQRMDITLSVEEFTVNDYSYTFSFSQPKEPFVTLSSPYFSLQPGESSKVTYDITPPASASPGGHYVTIVASTVLQIDDSAHTIEVASPLYVTIKGALRYTNTLVSSSVSTLAVGNTIPYRLDIKNQGNVHFPVYVSSTLKGMFSHYNSTEAAHLLLPNSTRRIDAVTPSPLLPGIYQLTYGYHTDHTQPITATTYILYLPVWWWAALPFGGWMIIVLLRRLTRRPAQVIGSRPPRDTQQT